MIKTSVIYESIAQCFKLYKTNDPDVVQACLFGYRAVIRRRRL